MYYENLKLDENNKPISVDIVCEKCGLIKHYTNMYGIFNWNEKCFFPDIAIQTKEQGVLKCECGNVHISDVDVFTKAYGYNVPSKNSHESSTRIKQSIAQARINNINAKPHCPTCNSTDISKISATSKVAGALGFGLFSKTARSQFKCNICGYKW